MNSCNIKKTMHSNWHHWNWFVIYFLSRSDWLKFRVTMLMIKFNGVACFNWSCFNSLRSLIAIRAIWRNELITWPSNGKRRHINELYTHFGYQCAFCQYQSRSSLIQRDCNSTNVSKFRWFMRSRVLSNGWFWSQYSIHKSLSIWSGRCISQCA